VREEREEGETGEGDNRQEESEAKRENERG
jgi:hypothetical protein